MAILSLLWSFPATRFIAIAAAAFVFGWTKGWSSVPRVDIAQVQRVAVEARDSEWRQKLEAQERDSEQKITAALEAAASVPAIASDNELDGLCAKSSSCRDRGKPKR